MIGLIPKVSVCIPVRNGRDYLASALNSIFRQTYTDFEIVIVDNASTDGTYNWLIATFGKDTRFRTFQNSENIGFVGNFNSCMGHAQGEYIKFLCADDLLYPECLKQMVAALEAEPAAALVTAGRMVIDVNGHSLWETRYSRDRQVVEGHEVINRCFYGRNYIGEPSTVMFRKSTAARGFDLAYTALMDLEMWFHLLEQGSMVSLPGVLAAFRVHEDQMTVNCVRSGALIRDNLRLDSAYGGKSYISRSIVNQNKRKVLMAYRIWLTRHGEVADDPEQLLAKRSAPWVYRALAPIFGMIVALRRSLLRRYRLFHTRS